MSSNDTIQRGNADEPLQTALDHIAYRIRNADKLPSKRARDQFVR